MRNHPVTWLLFVLKSATALFLLWASRFLLRSAIFDSASTAELWLMMTSWAMSVFEFGQVSSSLFYDVRNVARGLPLPTIFFPIETDHGDSIREVKANICDEPVEYLAVFTMMGFKLIEITNFHPSSIYRNKTVNELCEKYPGAITVHNHPGRDDFPFSPADVCSAMRKGLSRTIVVTRDSVYELSLPRQFSDEEAAQARKLMDKSEGLFGGLSRKNQMRACERVAAEFGMTFKQSARRK